MTENDVYCYYDAKGKIHILTEDELPKCPRTGEIASVFVIGGYKKKKCPHINGRGVLELTCNSCDSDYDRVKKGD